MKDPKYSTAVFVDRQEKGNWCFRFVCLTYLCCWIVLFDLLNENENYGSKIHQLMQLNDRSRKGKMKITATTIQKYFSLKILIEPSTTLFQKKNLALYQEIVLCTHTSSLTILFNSAKRGREYLTYNKQTNISKLFLQCNVK